MNRLILFSILLSTVFVFSNCSGTKRTTNNNNNDTTTNSSGKTGVQFVQSETLTAVLERAERENKLVFVDFYTTWCTPCKLMDKDVFPDKTIGKFFKKHFISYKVDAEKGNGVNLAVVFEVSVYPTLLFLNEKGRVLESKQGAAYHTELMEMANRALGN